MDASTDPADQVRILRHNHATAPGVHVLVETETVDSEVADRTQTLAVFRSAESLRRVFNERHTVPAADLPERECAGSLAVQVRNQHGPRPAVDQSFSLIRVHT